MKRYEVVLIMQADLPEEENETSIARYAQIVTGMDGTVVKIDKWGNRRLAYKIKKQSKGYYAIFEIFAKSAVVKELERNFKIDDKVLKFMTVLMDDIVADATVDEDVPISAEQQIPETTTTETTETQEA
ncbi:MAG: 30S ribosomal protein S6 [Deltaproteobacteria bacterium]